MKNGIASIEQLSFNNTQFYIEETKVKDTMNNGIHFTDVYNQCVNIWINFYK